MSQVSESLFGKLPNGEDVKQYIIRNKNGFEVWLISFGASVQSIKTYDRDGTLVDVVLGLNNLDEYIDKSVNRHFGGVVGRTSNRICNAEFELNGIKYILDKNNGENNLHGGNSGFDMRNWQSSIIADGVRFSIQSPEGEGGYPGQVIAEITYNVDPTEAVIKLEYRAHTTKPTPIDLTNHCYFNLNGKHSCHKIYNHEVKLNAQTYLNVSLENLIVTGEKLPVKGTKYDFSEFVRLSDRIEDNIDWPNGGYDNFFPVDQQCGNKHIASVRNPANGIRFDLFSDQNGVQFYTGNFLNQTLPSNGEKYLKHSGFCLETHNLPNAVNIPHFPSSIVFADGEYRQTTQWSFSVYN